MMIVMALEYEIVVERTERGVEIEAKPNEWSTNVTASITLPTSFGLDRKPRLYISWSCGARTWTIEDARTFFMAALKVMDVAEKEWATVAFHTPDEAK